MLNKIFHGDCINLLDNFNLESVDLIYLDPPFFTGKVFNGTKPKTKSYTFDDIWLNSSEYAKFLYVRLNKCHYLLKDTGSIIVHCDRNSVHIIRFILDQIFGKDNFQSEIIWFYKRWSNSKKGLLNQHQNLLFYSKTDNFKWNPQLVDYSPSTNIDQIFQKRQKDQLGKSIYAQDANGDILYGKSKKGVPLGDVWDIPYLNPKAKERTGYPTQKPLLLLERIIKLLTDEGDTVLDPFCGSGTTLVASKILNRNYIGIDISKEAVKLSQERLSNPIKTDSLLMKKGYQSYNNDNDWVTGHLLGLDFVRIHRNSGLDATLKQEVDGKIVFIKVQDKNESLEDSYLKIKKSLSKKHNSIGILIQTKNDIFNTLFEEGNIKIIKSSLSQIADIILI